ncbi:MAG: NTP transferase domain-containing protein [Caldisphaeraceae archaeon]|nr:NTP transferase domain-containing protein [Caldisphaeraceae archaeon]
MLIRASLIMAGGKGSRFGSSVKPFLRVCEKSPILNVIEEALKLSNIAFIAVSDYTTSYAKEAIDKSKYSGHILMIYTPGKGYAIDISLALGVIRERPLLVLPADYPFLTEKTIEKFLRLSLAYDEPVISLAQNGNFTGISLFKGHSYERWKSINIDGGKEFLNINTPEDLSKARSMCNDR